MVAAAAAKELPVMETVANSGYRSINNIDINNR